MFLFLCLFLPRGNLSKFCPNGGIAFPEGSCFARALVLCLCWGCAVLVPAAGSELAGTVPALGSAPFLARSCWILLQDRFLLVSGSAGYLQQ